MKDSKLEFINPESYNNQLIREINLGDISSKIEYWKNAIICYILGAHPSFTVLNGFIQRMWRKYGINKVAMMRNGILIVRFESEDGKIGILEGGIYHFDNKPIIVKEWTLEIEFSKEELLTVPIWVRLLGLNFKYWSARGLSKIGSLVGKPLMVDKQTEKKLYLSSAQILVEVNMGQKLPEEVIFRNEKRMVITQSETYDWKPSLCEHCQKYGHEKDASRKL